MGYRSTTMCVTAAALAAVGCTTTGSPMSSIRLEGNVVLSDAELREAAKGCEDTHECVSLIDERYLEEGYVDVRLTVEKSRLERWLGSRGGTLLIEEGEQFRVGSLTFVETDGPHDDDLADPAQLETLGKLRTGAVFHRSEVADFMRQVRYRYERAGYHGATLMPISDVNVDDREISLRFEIVRGDAGPPP